jgi:hypothetical protein
MELFVVGKYIKGEFPGTVWELVGVFDDDKKAIKACKGPNFFIGPVTLNEEVPDETIEWPGCYYPSERS